MQLGLSSLLLALACGQTAESSYQTTNFEVYAETAEAAIQVGDAAEKCRKDLGKLWHGTTLPDWSFPCRIDVALKAGKVGGVTQVSFSESKVLFQKVELQGPLERILKGPLPHELTHVLFAHHFGTQPPRWADEGGAILSEAERNGDMHRKLFRRILIEQRQFPLRELLAMREYPDDLPCLYAQGHSIARFLVEAKGHKVFLNFVRDGLNHSWDEASLDRYGYKNVEQMEKAWLKWLDNSPATKEAALRDTGRSLSLGSPGAANSIFLISRPSF